MNRHLAQFLVNTIAPLDLLDSCDRIHIYRHYGLKIGRDSFISPRCHFVYPDLINVKLGDRAFLNYNCFIENGNSITIGNNSCLAPFVRILTTTHQIGNSDRRVGRSCVRLPVKIGDGAWIGAGATILPGVTIGDGCVIGAGAIVHRDCEPNGLYVGVPARRVKDLGAMPQNGIPRSSNSVFS